MTVHPRSRGEHVRGHDVDGPAPRFIPARAGNTSGIRIVPSLFIGSSPLARGTPVGGGGEGVGDRFIPARAGNTTWPQCWSPRATVHPRSRGEHKVWKAVGSRYLGSSPLARGTPDAAGPSGSTRRFIPARAGNTLAGACEYRGRPVHPRSRGEHWPTRSLPSQHVGSSPLARGTLRPGRHHRRHHRFIPARAGNTHRPTPRTETTPVHPRSRGEHHTQFCLAWYATGSSPLARGTLEGEGPLYVRPRFIPARAGNTGDEAGSVRGGAVHPRSRGEHSSFLLRYPLHHGSSPLARGTRDRATADPCERRFIPARAGNTCGS